ncbi:PREDICTED: mediator of RNA polymerase II transcription subunit 13 isoform X2 [Nicrophorus vespilloides]|uniref:Mediator of RNA polymerase II transcription subunit 13 n=1 Tax=Nicrophorus vespilloides TaxID=110193 RepID=A0ABM1N430_NICVS|nr:PREDICTED: mediator of RNA polymerase II transcription subunit 13 isoform X2 [Nicrophorus vespilloides]
MTHPNLQTNGASLEDCHTNFFALTELSGIKWRKLVWSDAVGVAVDPLEDPVLRSYARCLAADILCVWRRISTPHQPTTMFDIAQPPSQPPPLSLCCSKELWIFWYGEEPDLHELVSNDLLKQESEQGSWESGLSYECRSLLFKALHNLIERCLLSRDFIRLGKWFVQPYESPRRTTEGCSAHLSFSFAFFVHGESSVCASVDVRQHPPVRKLARIHLQQAQASTSGLKVILAPFGLAGTLTGQCYKTMDSGTRMLDEWSQFYPIEKGNGESNVVEVIVGGVKMRYPACYVLVTDMDDHDNSSIMNGVCLTPSNAANTLTSKNGSSLFDLGTPITIQTPPPSPVQINSRVPQPGPFSVSVEHPASSQRSPTAATVLPERVWQECIHGGPPQTGPHENSGHWDFVDPTRKTNCTCSKCPGLYTPHGGPPSYPRTQESMVIPSVGSPPSAAPSPLPNPHSQPASVPPGDQVMPTLSPHPPTVAESPLDKSLTPDQPPKSTGSTVNSPHPVAESKENIPVTVSPIPSLKRPVLISKEYESAVGEEEHSLDLLYDYSIMNAWLNHPVKRFKPDDKENQKSSYTKNGDIYSMITPNGMNTNNNENKNNVNNGNNTQMHFIKQEIKQEPGCQMDSSDTPPVLQSIGSGGGHHGVKRPGDPYEFEEDVCGGGVGGGGGGTNATGAAPNASDNFKRGQVGATKDEIKKAGNLFTSEGLQPSYKDLDQIFDNSDDTSSDEATQIQTPPGSNKSSGGQHDDGGKRYSGHTSSGGGGGGCLNAGGLRPEELCKMFPTPPSLEHNPIASPCATQDQQPPDHLDFGGIIRINQSIYPSMGSPQEENIEDWSYVFKPPIMCKLVGSSKYAPLTNLPSQNMPPVCMPTNCVYKPSWQQHIEKSSAATTTTSTSTTTAASTVTTTSSTATTTQVPNTVPTPQVTPNPVPPGSGGGNATGGPGSVGGSSVTGPISSQHGFPPSPLHAGFRPPPPPYELPSPATSTASSYLNKNLNSVEPVNTPCVQRTPEASSLLVNILLADTLLNIFRDHNFDSCTLCVCNAGLKVVGNIRGADAGVYLLSADRNSSSHHQSTSHMPLQNSPFPGGGGGMGQPPPPYGGMLGSPTHAGSGGGVGGMLMDEDSIKCSCGFSAVVNRRLAHRSGLFYEDELEITGIAEDPGERKKVSLMAYLMQNSSTKMDPNIDRDQLDQIPYGILELIREQCVMIQSTANSLSRSTRYRRKNTLPYSNSVNILEFSDGNEVTGIALDQSKHQENLMMCKMEEAAQRKGADAVHRWPFLRASGPQCNQDIVRVMKSLQPLLQEAIQKKCQTRLWEPPSAVKGPLTWRQFHRLAGRGTDDRCEPQPIPSVVVGHEKDWLSLSPYALHHWETLLLEPYSYSRDVAYIVVAPDSDAILPKVRTFFKELSNAYEMCRLGRHSPITKVLRDGILRVGKTAKTKLSNEPVEEWFTLLGESETTDMLKLYAQVCKHHLAPHLQQVPMDKTLLDPPTETVDRPAASPMPPPPSTPDNSQSSTGLTNNNDNSKLQQQPPSTPKSESSETDLKEVLQNCSNTLPNGTDMTHDEDDQEAPSVVVYLIDPFSMGSDQPELQRLACIALLRCFQSVLSAVPENIRSNISVQIISQESIVELGRARERQRYCDHMRSLALSIFSQCRRHLVHTNNVKSLTGFGTAAMADLFLKSKDEKNRAPYKLYTPPYVLGPLKGKAENAESFGQGNSDQSSILYLSYCLSEDQSYLLAVATDEKGEIFETQTINIDIPNRSRRKKGTANARRVGLQKLMDFVLGVISMNVKPWRLVVGRLGRIGHGELKGWSFLLSRKNLLKASKHLKEICTQCMLMYPNNVPCILSACLVSLEPDSTLRLMPDQFTPDERFSQISVNSQLNTPQDVTCTHILVFPTSATTQSSQTTFQEQNSIDPDEEFFNINDLHDDMNEGIDDFSDIFNWTDTGPGGAHSPTGSPRRDEMGNPGSPTGMNVRQVSPFQCATSSQRGDLAEEVGTVLQQPLALGYLVSTAPTGRMPGWFWASCPHLEGVCPAFLKNALHLHSPNIQQSSEDLLQQSAITSHALDSQYTTDVLRYVLEGYNALSWLALDTNTRDRLSCLPVHIQALTRLYHTTSTLL